MQKLSVLLVDDNPRFRKAARELLTGLPCVADVECAESGEEALALARGIRPDVVVTDIAMPGMSGFGLMRALRALDVTLRIVVATLHEDIEFQLAARRTGADWVVVKEHFALRLPRFLATLAAGNEGDRRSSTRAPQGDLRDRSVAPIGDQVGDEASHRAPAFRRDVEKGGQGGGASGKALGTPRG